MLDKVYETTISAIGKQAIQDLDPWEKGNSEHHNHINHLVALFGDKQHWEEKTQKSKQVIIEIKDEFYWGS